MKLLIYEVRSKKGISGRKLADMTGISASTLHRYEKYGNQNVNLKDLEKIAKALNCKIIDLFESQYKM